MRFTFTKHFYFQFTKLYTVLGTYKSKAFQSVPENKYFFKVNPYLYRWQKVLMFHNTRQQFEHKIKKSVTLIVSEVLLQILTNNVKAFPLHQIIQNMALKSFYSPLENRLLILIRFYLINVVVKSSLAKQVTFSSLKNKSPTVRVRKRVLLLVALVFFRSIRRLII